MSFAAFWQSSLVLRVGLRENFSGADFFCFLSVALCFCWGFAYVFFCVFSCKFAPEVFKMFSSCQVLLFWFVLLVLGFGLTTSLLFLFLLLSLFLTKEKVQV